MTFEELLAIDDPRRSGTFATGVDMAVFADWSWGLESAPLATTFEDQPERVNLTELVPAWHAGLRTVVELPFGADWARRVSATHLLIATRTRHSRMAYGQALALPIERAI